MLRSIFNSWVTVATLVVLIIIVVVVVVVVIIVVIVVIVDIVPDLPQLPVADILSMVLLPSKEVAGHDVKMGTVLLPANITATVSRI
jgi:hypothetical protein